MDLIKAKKIAYELLDLHQLYDFEFFFDNAKLRFGRCNVGTVNTITISKILTKNNSEKHFRDTMLHEIAHALVKEGHTEKWKKMCIEIGADPTSDYSDEVKVITKFKFACKCGNVRNYVTRPKCDERICGICFSKLKLIEEKQ